MYMAIRTVFFHFIHFPLIFTLFVFSFFSFFLSILSSESYSVWKSEQVGYCLLELTEVDMRKACRMSLMISFVQKLKGWIKWTDG